MRVNIELILTVGILFVGLMILTDFALMVSAQIMGQPNSFYLTDIVANQIYGMLI